MNPRREEAVTFGDPARFAVSIELDEEYHGAWLNGSICYWVDDLAVGDWKHGASLRDAIWSITRIVFALPAGHAFRTIDTVLYGDEKPLSDDLAECGATYDVTPTVGPFSGWKTYLVDGERSARRLYQDPSDVIRSFHLELGEFDRVIRATFDRLDAWYEREAPWDIH